MNNAFNNFVILTVALIFVFLTVPYIVDFLKPIVQNDVLVILLVGIYGACVGRVSDKVYEWSKN